MIGNLDIRRSTREEQIALNPLLMALGNFLKENYDENVTTVGDVFKTEEQLQEFARQQLSEEQFQKLVALGLVGLQ